MSDPIADAAQGGARRPIGDTHAVDVAYEAVRGEHPSWCQSERCTADGQLVAGQHRGPVTTALWATGIRVSAYMSCPGRPGHVETIIHVTIETALHGRHQVAMTAREAHELGRFLARFDGGRS